MGFRPSAPRADVSTVPPRPQKMEHPQGRAPCSLSYQDSPSLSTAWMHGRSGRTCTSVARQGIAFTARCICCSATLRKKLGLERDSHPRPSPYEGAALTAAPSSQMVGRLGEARRSDRSAGRGPGPERAARVKCSEFFRLRGGSFTVEACDPKNGCGSRTRTSIHGFKVRCPSN